MNTILNEKKEVLGTADVMEPNIKDGEWTLAQFIPSQWKSKAKKNVPYTGKFDTFLVKKIAGAFTLFQTIAVMEKN